MEPIKVLVCQTCGDEGFTNAFVYCVKCLEFAIHRYCLKEMPKSYTERVIWYCESCQTTVENEVTSPNKSSEPQKKERKKNIDPIRNENMSSYSNSSCSSSYLIEFDEWEARIGKQNQRIDEIIDDVIMNYPRMILEDHPPTERTRYRSLIEETKGAILNHNIPKKKRTNRKRISAFKRKEHNNDPQWQNYEYNFQDNYYRHARPIIDPIWRGSFKVLGTDYDDLFEGFVGHLSDKACGKVFEEANMMPSLLILEMHPKTFLWPKSFQDCEPSDDHIGLYFFPGDPINEKAFDGLVLEMMDDDLAMRAASTNADLLIFTSSVLPKSFRRFRGKYYLWGVFRTKKNDGPKSICSSPSTSDSSQDYYFPDSSQDY
ncbi:unnamed protein product [Lactuca virosa]|uniref:AIPP2-like SPOC-like domain-containing protein n=1 Tax=Lactuca virosa TaxID=75947 RepID=A0AAU9LI15_9ASTR|nr:unnamed protein product [Lactuca virosa]